MKSLIFTLTSARSGTLFLRNLFRQNIKGCCTRHEPFFDWGNPTMLGPAIYAASVGRLDIIRELLARKRDYINHLGGDLYVESSHAFLKSAYLVALEFFPETRFIHLIRDPLKVAKSEAYREAWRRRVHAPFHYYKGGDGRGHFYWSLTGNEEIFNRFERDSLSLFQWYLVQWIEIENRAMAFLSKHALQPRCFTLQCPGDLNNPDVIGSMFEFFGLTPSHSTLTLAGRKNKSLGRTTIVTAQDEQAATQVLSKLSPSYLQIFGHEPYLHQTWNTQFRRLLGLGSHMAATACA